MKKVLFLAYTYPPDSRSGTFRVLHFANELARNGNYKPIVLTVKESDYDKEVSFDHQLLEDVDSNVDVVKTRCFQLRDSLVAIKKKSSKGEFKILEKDNNDNCNHNKKTLLTSLKDLVTEGILSFPDRQSGWFPFAVLSGWKILKNNNVDVIIATGSPWTTFCVGFALKVICKKPLVIDYRDPWNDNTFSGKNKTFEKISRYLENIVVKKSDAIIANTESFKKVLQNRFPEKRNIYTVHNGYSISDISDVKPEGNSLVGREFIMTYAGALYGHRTIENFLYAFKDLLVIDSKYETIRLRFVGVNSDTMSVAAKILGEDVALKHCSFSGRVPHKECLSILMRSDCLIIFQQGTVNQVPRKIFEYIAIKKPILAITDCSGETADIINRNSIGIAVEDDKDSVKIAIKKLFDNYEKIYKEIIEKNIAERYEVKSLAMQVEKILDVVSSV